jgi:rubredoxin
MWWECSECGCQFERAQAPAVCDECGRAGALFACVGLSTVGPDDDVMSAWTRIGYERTHGDVPAAV